MCVEIVIIIIFPCLTSCVRVLGMGDRMIDSGCDKGSGFSFLSG